MAASRRALLPVAPPSSLIQEAKSLLNQLGASSRKKMGQNFMVREDELSFIADAADLREGETVLEIGPGLGFLTRFLLQKKANVLAVECDKIYARFLRDYFYDREFRLIESDILKIDIKQSFQSTYPIKVVGNIPYNITSPILQWLIRQRQLIREAVLTTQWEVADRLTAKPGSKSWGTLSIFLQFYAEVSWLKKISPSSFYPSPKVDSAVIRVQFLKKPRFKIPDEEIFFKLVRRAFQKRRKTLLNALADENLKNYSKPLLAQAFTKAAIDPMRRSETLTLEEWVRLYEPLTSRSVRG